MSEASLSKVTSIVRAAEASHPTSRPMQHPMDGGWIPWAAFHLKEPSQTMSMLRKCDQYAAVQRLFTKFSVHALISRAGIEYDRFVYLTTFQVQLSADQKQSKVSFDKRALHGEAYTVGKAFVIQASIATVTGISHTATLWMEGDTVEIFNPWGYRSGTLNKLISEHVLPFLRQKWMPATAKPKVLQYKLGAGIEGMNWWNLYFIFLRSAHPKPVDRFFGPYVEIASIHRMRDKVIQACGRIIAKCAEALDSTPQKRMYRSIFGPEAPAVSLTKDIVEHQIPNIFNRCSIPSDALWNTFDDMDPELSAGAPGAAGGAGSQVSLEWPADVDPAWKPFIETTKKKMVFVSP